MALITLDGRLRGIRLTGAGFRSLSLPRRTRPTQRAGWIALRIDFLPDQIALFIALYLAYFGCKSSLVLFYGVRKFVAAVLLLTSVVLAVGRFFLP